VAEMTILQKKLQKILQGSWAILVQLKLPLNLLLSRKNANVHI
jgi:hypothetical protein